jgi:hypothetical protein
MAANDNANMDAALLRIARETLDVCHKVHTTNDIGDCSLLKGGPCPIIDSVLTRLHKERKS